MKTTDITEKNLIELVSISTDFNSFRDGYLEKKFKEALELESLSMVYVNFYSIFLIVLYHSNFEFYPIKDFEEEALEFLAKDLKDMPIYINPRASGYNWIPIVARWRLSCGL
jgi:hypothetical protein